jgi:hypothetical protein
MLDGLFSDFGIGNVVGALVAWYLATGNWVVVPWLVVILGWRIGDMILPNSAMPLNPFISVQNSPYQNLQFPKTVPFA